MLVLFSVLIMMFWSRNTADILTTEIWFKTDLIKQCVQFTTCSSPKTWCEYENSKLLSRVLDIIMQIYCFYCCICSSGSLHSRKIAKASFEINLNKSRDIQAHYYNQSLLVKISHRDMRWIFADHLPHIGLQYIYSVFVWQNIISFSQVVKVHIVSARVVFFLA